MYEKLIKMCCRKAGFEIQRYIPLTDEMKNRILSKDKGCPFFLLPKIYKLPEYHMIFARKILFSRIWGGGQVSPPLSPVSYAYGSTFAAGRRIRNPKTMQLIANHLSICPPDLVD